MFSTARFSPSLAFAVAAVAIGFALPAAAQTSTNGVLPVNANVVDVCTLNVSAAVDFGTYNPTSATADDDGVGVLQLACTTGTVATILLDQGANGGATRAMDDGFGNTLGYELFADAGRSTLWGDDNATHAGASVTPAAAPSIAPRTFSVFGRIFAGQDVPANAFSDAVNVTVNW